MKAARRTRWNAGDAVLFRSILDTGRIGAVVPMTVVGDEDELVALYLAPGTVCKRRAGRRGGPRGRQMVEDSGLHEDWTWRENRRLFLWQPNAGHAVSLFWRDADDTFLGWYVDVLRPMRRTPLGFDTRDLILDVVVNPDRSWQLKDEDELRSTGRFGRMRRTTSAPKRCEPRRCLRPATRSSTSDGSAGNPLQRGSCRDFPSGGTSRRGNYPHQKLAARMI